MTKSSYRQTVKSKIQTGRYVEHKGLSICKINDFYKTMNNKVRYQVDCRSFSSLYENIEDALNKFFELRGKMR